MPMTPFGRAAFCKVFHPDPKPDMKGKHRYKMVLIFDQEAQSSPEYAAMIESLEQVVKDKWPTRPRNLKWPIKDAEDMINREGERYAGFDDGCKCIEVWSYQAPSIVGPDPSEDLEEGQFKSGDYCRISYRAYAFDNESKGVNIGLGNIQKWKSGPSLGGGKTDPVDDFDAIDVPASDPTENIPF